MEYSADVTRELSRTEATEDRQMNDEGNCELDIFYVVVMGMMNLIIYVTTAVSLLSSGSRSETPSFVVNATTVTTTTLNWVPSLPHNVSHGVSEDDSKETGVSHDPHVDSDDDHDDEKYSNPRKDPQDCNLGDDPAWLCNEDDVLDEETGVF